MAKIAKRHGLSGLAACLLCAGVLGAAPKTRARRAADADAEDPRALRGHLVELALKTTPGQRKGVKALEEICGRYLAALHLPAIDRQVLERGKADLLKRYLRARKEFLLKLLLAFDVQDDPGRAFLVVADLLASKSLRRAPDRYPDLVVALAVTHDTQNYSREDVRARLLYFAGSGKRKRKFVYSVGKLSWRMLRRLVDFRSHPSELAWAAQRHGGNPNLARLYRSVRLDTASLLHNKDKRLVGKKYTLQNTPLFDREIRRIFPDWRDMTESTLAARLNGYLAGNGFRDVLEREIDAYGLSDAARVRLLEMAPFMPLSTDEDLYGVGGFCIAPQPAK